MPTGRHLVSFYFFNKDGHDGKNRLRDFVLSAKIIKPIDVEIKNNNTKNVAGSINNLKPNKRYEILTSWKADAKNPIAIKGYAAVSLNYDYNQQNIAFDILLNQPSLDTDKTGLFASFDIRYGNQRYDRTTQFL